MTARRVCHLASGDLWAGAEVQTAEMLRGLARTERYRPSAILLNEGRLADEVRASSIPVTVLDESKLGFVELVRRVADLQRRQGYDILHTHRYKENTIAVGAVAVVRAMSGKRPKLVQTIHGASEPFPGLRGLRMRVFNELDSALARNGFDLVQVVSRDLRNRLEERLAGVPMVMIHNSARVDPNPPSRNEARRALGLDEDRPVIGALGRLEPVKNMHALLRAVSLLRARRPELLVLIAGSGSEREALEESAGRLGLDGAVRFLGFRDDVSTVLSSLDVYVMSSLHEGIPTSLIEAMSLGVPCVCTRVGGIAEVLGEEAGVLVEPDDDSALAREIGRLLDDPNRRMDLGERSRRRAREGFSPEHQLAELVMAYDELIP